MTGMKKILGKIKETKTRTPLWVVILGILAVTYLGISIYFTKHFLFNTYVNDIEAFNMTAKDMEEDESNRIKAYTLRVYARGDIVETITSDDVQFTLEIGDQFEKALKNQNPFIWPYYLFNETKMTTDDIATYPRDIVENRAATMQIFNNQNIAEPVDAHLSETPGDDGFYVVPEDPGKKPIRENVINEICDALDILEVEITLSDDCYEKPGIISDDSTLNALADSLNKYCKAVITYEFGADTIVADGSVIKEWCDISGTSVSLNKDKVREFVNSIARKYDSFGKTRHFVTNSGEAIDIEGGDYGWWMDRATETSELMDAVTKGEKATRTPVYFGTAAAYGDKDWGTSYVEIDLTSQHLWVYQDGMVVEESDFVSGCVNKGRTTPRGTYGITYKERDATLVGENYSSPVKYWMPFNGNVGMHDASWRHEFGGELYVSDGSHGCINLPTDKAAHIFDLVSKGEAVLVYGGKTVPEIPPEEVPVDGQVMPDGTIYVAPVGGEAPFEDRIEPPVVGDEPAAEIIEDGFQEVTIEDQQVEGVVITGEGGQ